MKPNETPEILLQHGNDHVLVRFIPTHDAIYIRKVDVDGTTIPNSQEIISITDHPGLECLHDGHGWYPPLLMKVLRYYDDQLEDWEPPRKGTRIVPTFIKRHYMKKGQSLV